MQVIINDFVVWKVWAHDSQVIVLNIKVLVVIEKRIFKLKIVWF